MQIYYSYASFLPATTKKRYHFFFLPFFPFFFFFAKCFPTSWYHFHFLYMYLAASSMPIFSKRLRSSSASRSRSSASRLDFSSASSRMSWWMRVISSSSSVLFWKMFSRSFSRAYVRTSFCFSYSSAFLLRREVVLWTNVRILSLTKFSVLSSSSSSLI